MKISKDMTSYCLVGWVILSTVALPFLIGLIQFDFPTRFGNSEVFRMMETEITFYMAIGVTVNLTAYIVFKLFKSMKVKS
ncbi:hypothetical protein L0B53_18970 (plasmid) [Vibrio sp. SS-MA-C1-2]|uniref:hypothetical protein n=1 Tax=Vibrio sp. SS-MA-C1-2 TaxID=2908646 RepID=UPI001F36B95B|nr:hypothetical protein [Vibrio sp. SS-MA-C1-2]UJF20219.1 hypothetical protein L0B53_18970 [Vibrio sp. SS-MA-C1-2]